MVTRERTERQTVLVLDFGGQYKELIARSARGLRVHSVILPGFLRHDVIIAKWTNKPAL